jgi:pimeloyl-ACP methyl ester carboxylesterase
MAARLRRAPIRRRVERRGRRVPVRVDADDLLSLLVSGDQLPSFLQEVPAAVRAALRGRTGQLARMKLEALEIESPGPIREFSPALFAATICEEAPVAWDRAAPPAVRRAQALQALAPVPPAAFGPFDRAAAIEAGTLPLCADWPAPIRPPAPDLPLPRGLPALVLSGELDLRTPLESARALAAALPARLVVERGVGHSVLGADPAGCAGPATAAFLAGTELPGCDGPG